MALRNFQLPQTNTLHDGHAARTYMNQIAREKPQPFTTQIETGVPGVPIVCFRSAYGDSFVFRRYPTITIGRRDIPHQIFPTMNLADYGGLHTGVSRKHAKIIYFRDNFHVMDLDSSNGTKVNGRHIAPQQMTPIYENDEITFGNFVMYLVWISQDQEN